MLSIICVIGPNREIGYNNQLLWHIGDDLKHFKKITSGHPVIMGQKTYESLGRPLPNRTNIILTQDPNFKVDGCQIFYSIPEALEYANKIDPIEVFIIGGGSIYRQFLPMADKLYLTMVENTPANVDTYFPEYENLFKNVVSEEPHESEGLKYKFVELVK